VEKGRRHRRSARAGRAVKGQIGRVESPSLLRSAKGHVRLVQTRPFCLLPCYPAQPVLDLGPSVESLPMIRFSRSCPVLEPLPQNQADEGGLSQAQTVCPPLKKGTLWGLGRGSLRAFDVGGGPDNGRLAWWVVGVERASHGEGQPQSER
jgi:hypothetical protein